MLASLNIDRPGSDQFRRGIERWRSAVVDFGLYLRRAVVAATRRIIGVRIKWIMHHQVLSNRNERQNGYVRRSRSDRSARIADRHRVSAAIVDCGSANYVLGAGRAIDR